MTRPRHPHARRLVAAGALALSLAGCGTHPGVAAPSAAPRSAPATSTRSRARSARPRPSTQQPGRPGAVEPLQPRARAAAADRLPALGGLRRRRRPAALAGAAQPGDGGPRSSCCDASRRSTATRSGPRSPTSTEPADDGRGRTSRARAGRQPEHAAQTAIPAGIKLRDDWVESTSTSSVDPRFGTCSNATWRPRAAASSAFLAGPCRRGAADLGVAATCRPPKGS